MINEATGSAEQFIVGVQGKAGKMDSLSVRVSLVATNFYLDSSLVRQCSCQQGQATVVDFGVPGVTSYG